MQAKMSFFKENSDFKVITTWKHIDTLNQNEKKKYFRTLNSDFFVLILSTMAMASNNFATGLE